MCKHLLTIALHIRVSALSPCCAQHHTGSPAFPLEDSRGPGSWNSRHARAAVGRPVDVLLSSTSGRRVQETSGEGILNTVRMTPHPSAASSLCSLRNFTASLNPQAICEVPKLHNSNLQEPKPRKPASKPTLPAGSPPILPHVRRRANVLTSMVGEQRLHVFGVLCLVCLER